MPLYSVIVHSIAYAGKDKIHIVEAKNAQNAKQNVANWLWARYGEDPDIIKKMTVMRY